MTTNDTLPRANSGNSPAMIEMISKKLRYHVHASNLPSIRSSQREVGAETKKTSKIRKHEPIRVLFTLGGVVRALQSQHAEAARDQTAHGRALQGATDSEDTQQQHKGQHAEYNAPGRRSASPR